MKNQGKRYRNPGSVLMIVYGPDDKIPVVRDIAHYDPRWKFPGGHIKFGETPREASVRELEEETLLKMLKEDVSRLLVPKDMGSYLTHIYGGEIKSFDSLSQGHIIDGKAVLESGLLTPDQILTIPGFLLQHRRIFMEVIYG